MAVMANILRALEGHILHRCGSEETIPAQLLLLEPGMALTGGHTYLGTPEVLQTLPPPAGPVTVLLAAPGGCRATFDLPGTLVVTDLELIPLYNRVAWAMSDAAGQSVEAFFGDLFEERLQDEEELRQRLEALPCPVQGFVSFIVIRRTASTDLPLQEQMLRELKTLLPGDNIGWYHHDLVVLHTQPERTLGRLDWDTGAMTDFLHRHEAHAGVSHATRLRIHLRTLWRQAAEAAHLGRIFQWEGDSDCIFTWQDYALFSIIDLCATAFQQLHHHDDLIYLVHPAIIAICRYDAAHNTNLREVLFHYLLSHCSLNKTAQRMYMHRNTVHNKLNKIEEITQLSMQDGRLQVYLIISCLIMRYYEQYMGKKVIL